MAIPLIVWLAVHHTHSNSSTRAANRQECWKLEPGPKAGCGGGGHRLCGSARPGPPAWEPVPNESYIREGHSGDIALYTSEALQELPLLCLFSSLLIQAVFLLILAQDFSPACKSVNETIVPHPSLPDIIAILPLSWLHKKLWIVAEPLVSVIENKCASKKTASAIRFRCSVRAVTVCVMAFWAVGTLNGTYWLFECLGCAC